MGTTGKRNAFRGILKIHPEPIRILDLRSAWDAQVRQLIPRVIDDKDNRVKIFCKATYSVAAVEIGGFCGVNMLNVPKGVKTYEIIKHYYTGVDVTKAY